MKFPSFIPTPAYCEIIDDNDENWVRIDLDFDPIAKADIESFDHNNIVIFTQDVWTETVKRIEGLEAQVEEFEITVRSKGS